MKKTTTFTLILAVFAILSCRKDQINTTAEVTPYVLEYPTYVASFLPPMPIPTDNPMTEEGVELGRKLFFDTKLSANNSQACASCHLPSNGFADPLRFSVGIDGVAGDISSMPLFNLGWAKSFFWDGRSPSLEAQALEPVIDPIEMHNTWPNAVATLQADKDYPFLFRAAFGTDIIDSVMVAKALAQFERTLMSWNSPYDKYLRGEPTGYTQAQTQKMLNGYNVFISENKADCFHCHGENFNPLWTSNEFHNNGLDAQPRQGLAAVTGDPSDVGRFKTPSVRNLLLTPPYMHDGRFNTIEEVVEHYSTGLVWSPTIDPLMKDVDDGGVNLNPQDKSDLVFFLKSLTDSSFITNPAFQNPN